MDTNNLKNIFKSHNGAMRTKEVYEDGVTTYEVKKLIDIHVLERVGKGYYRLFDEEISDIKLISIFLPNGVLCFDSEKTDIIMKSPCLLQI